MLESMKHESHQERMINAEEEEGKGRSMKYPWERLKFQIFPTVVTLLSLEQWRNAHGANRPDARWVSNFFKGHKKLLSYCFRCLEDSVELVCKPKDHSDLTSPPQTRDRTRWVCTLCLLIVRTYFLLAWINSFGTCTVLIARDREASLVHSD